MKSKVAEIQGLLNARQGRTPVAALFDRESELSLAMLEVAHQRNMQLVNLEVYKGDLPANIQVEGAVTTRLPEHNQLQDLLRQGVPVVRLGRRPHPLDEQIPAVITDQRATGRMAADHFAERDFQHVAYLGRTPWGNSRELCEGLGERAKELGLQFHLLRETNNPTLPPGQEQSPERWGERQKNFCDWIATLPKPVGLLAFHDMVADRYCIWLMQAGIRVPEDVAVLGYGNNPFTCEAGKVPLSSIAIDYRGHASAALDLLQTLMNGEKPQQCTVQVPASGVVTRPSTDVLAASDPNVVKALRFMWDHVTQNLSVDQIAEHVAVSRRTLERAFDRELGRGINQEFQRRRLEKARELLLKTDSRISDISDALSFNSQSQFCRVFRAHYGMSPIQYRNRHNGNGKTEPAVAST